MRLAPALLLLLPASLTAADLAVVKTTQVVSDGVNALNPKALPGARVEYRLTVNNPVGNLGATVAGEGVSDPIDPGVKLSLADLGSAGGGPVAFEDGSVLGTGVAASGLTYSYGGLASTTDGLDFYDGTSWSYVPVADADGCDARVRAIRVRLTGTQAAATSFRLRYRVAIR